MTRYIGIRYNPAIKVDSILNNLHQFTLYYEIDDDDLFLIEMAMGKLIVLRKICKFLWAGILVTNGFWIANHYGWF